MRALAQQTMRETARRGRTFEERSSITYDLNPGRYRYAIGLHVETGDAETVRLIARDFASWGFEMVDGYDRAKAEQAS